MFQLGCFLFFQPTAHHPPLSGLSPVALLTGLLTHCSLHLPPLPFPGPFLTFPLKRSVLFSRFSRPSHALAPPSDGTERLCNEDLLYIPTYYLPPCLPVLPACNTYLPTYLPTHDPQSSTRHPPHFHLHPTRISFQSEMSCLNFPDPCPLHPPGLLPDTESRHIPDQITSSQRPTSHPMKHCFLPFRDLDLRLAKRK